MKYNKTEFQIKDDRLIRYFGCEKVVSIPEGVKSIAAQAFSGCLSIEQITISSSVKLIGSLAFSNCENLKTINIENDYVSIGDNSFENTWYINSYPKDCVIYIGLTAYKYNGKCPKELYIREGTLGIAAFAFSHCKELEKITIPGTVENIPAGAFCNCSNLTNVVLGEGTKKISDMCFWGCEKIVNLTLPITITSIGESFRNHPRTLKIFIQENVCEIHPTAFNYCDVDICCIPNSYAEKYAKDNHFKYTVFIPKRLKENLTLV